MYLRELTPTRRTLKYARHRHKGHYAKRYLTSSFSVLPIMKPLTDINPIGAEQLLRAIYASCAEDLRTCWKWFIDHGEFGFGASTRIADMDNSAKLLGRTYTEKILREECGSMYSEWKDKQGNVWGGYLKCHVCSRGIKTCPVARSIRMIAR